MIFCLLEVISEEVFVKMVEKIVECIGKIVVVGCGIFGVVVKKLVYFFNCIECLVVFLILLDVVYGIFGVF